MKSERIIQVKASSPLAPYIYKYIELKRTYGFKYNPETVVLNQFDKFCSDQGLCDPCLDGSILDEWSKKRINENETTHKLRVRVVRAFSVYLRQAGIESPSSFHPLPKESSEFMPYIFIEDEIKRLFYAIDSKFGTKVSFSPVRHEVIPVLFRMIYGCGLRISEATALKKTEVNLTNGHVKILDAKGDQDRVVVMSESLKAVCQEYVDKPAMSEFETDYFFPAPDHYRYSSNTIYQTFRTALREAGISHLGRGKGPRVHDLRHTFAVHVLSKWQREGKDLYVCLPILCDYLGHKNLKSTERYLRLVPETYAEVTDPYAKKFGGVFPEVTNEKS